MSSNTHENEQEDDHASHTVPCETHPHTDTSATHSFYVTAIETEETQIIVSTGKDTAAAASATAMFEDNDEILSAAEECDSISPTRVAQLNIAASEEDDSSLCQHDNCEHDPLTVTTTPSKLNRPFPDAKRLLSPTTHTEQEEEEADAASVLYKQESQAEPGPHLRIPSIATTHRTKSHKSKRKQRISIQLMRNAMNFLDTFAVEVDEGLTRVSDKIGNLEEKVHLLEDSWGPKVGEIEVEDNNNDELSSSTSSPSSETDGCLESRTM